MVSRRSRIQDKKITRTAIFLVFSSIVLFLFLIYVGLPFFAKIAIFLSQFKKSSPAIQQGDKVPPAYPHINQLPSYTNEKIIMITGTAEIGSNLKLFKNEKVIKETIIDESNIYSFETELSEGKNIITATAEDQAGNVSEKSPPVQVIYNIEEPELTITSPENESIIDNQKSITILGKTNLGNKVTVNDRFIIIQDDGSFSTKYTLSEGENNLIFIATDQAGNTIKKEVKVTYSP